jgi:hypothetical protein
MCTNQSQRPKMNECRPVDQALRAPPAQPGCRHLQAIAAAAALAVIAWLAGEPAGAAQPAAGLAGELDLRAESASDAWRGSPAAGPEVGPLSTLYGCWTEREWCLYCSCSAHIFRAALCERTTCRRPPHLGEPWDPPWVEYVESSEGCGYCDDPESMPDFCPAEDCLEFWDDILEHEPLTYSRLNNSRIERMLDHYVIELDQYLGLDAGLQEYGRIGTAGFACDFNNAILYSRPENVSPAEPATLELNVPALSLQLDTGLGEETIGYSAAALLVTSPQLGPLFSCAVHQPKDGLAVVEGDVPAQAFERAPGLARLVGYQHPPIVIEIPPGMMEVAVEIRYASSGAADFDRNGNGNPDQFDISEGLSLDENHNLIPDEVEPFGLLHTALGQALLWPGSSGALVITNIGPTGQDGVRADLPQVRSYRAELAPLPPVESLPIGAGLGSAAGGSHAGQPDMHLGHIRATKVEPGEQAALFADFTSIGVDAVNLIMFDDSQTQVYKYQGYELDPESAFARANKLPQAIGWQLGPDEPFISAELAVVLEYEGLVEYSLPGAVLEIDNAMLVVEINNGIKSGSSVGCIGRVRHRAAGIETFALVSETIEALLEPGDMNCDGDVNFDDIEAFVAALSSQAAYEAEYPDCDWYNADCNSNGNVDFDDVDAFVALLAGS